MQHGKAVCYLPKVLHEVKLGSVKMRTPKHGGTLRPGEDVPPVPILDFPEVLRYTFFFPVDYLEVDMPDG